MNKFTKVCAALLGLVAFQAEAAAQTVSPANIAVTASGQLTSSLRGGFLKTTCNVTLYGMTDATGITFTSMTGTTVSGPLSCNDGIVFPLRIQATSPTSVTIKNMTVATRFGNCGPSDVTGPWNNATSTAGPLTASLRGPWGTTCQSTGSLTISPSITIR